MDVCWAAAASVRNKPIPLTKSIFGVDGRESFIEISSSSRKKWLKLDMEECSSSSWMGLRGVDLSVGGVVVGAVKLRVRSKHIAIDVVIQIT